MYTQFFQLKQVPFSIAPDPRYLFMSERHREALAHLLYGVGSGGGFVLLTGEIGAGKTTVCRCLLEQIPENCHVAYIFNPKLSVGELLQSICEEFRIDVASQSAASSPKACVDALNAYLLQSHAAGKNNVLIIDEAQNLAPEVLEQLRLLTNLETSERKLLQVILIGQPELRDMLARPELEQLAQRVIARYHLDALSPQETAGYIHYRMSIAGAAALQPFPAALMPRIHRLTHGIPRRINLLCDRALLGAYAAGRSEITPAIIDQAAREVFGADSRMGSTTGRRWQLAAAGLAGAVLTGALAWAWQLRGAAPDPAVQAVLAEQAGKYKLSHVLSTRQAWQRTSTPALARKQATPAAASSELAPLLVEATQDQFAAFRLLGQLWGIALGQEDPCDALQSRNVHCHTSTGGLAELRQLNRPAILKLYDGQQGRHHVLLTGISDTKAELRFTGSEQDREIDLKTLEKHFKGEFVTLWRGPPGYSGKIGPGQSGEAVDWLGAQLSRIDGGVESVQGQAFGAAMTRNVRQFQKAHGLPPDGIAGARTLMLLNIAADVPEPRLRRKPALTTALSGE